MATADMLCADASRKRFEVSPAFSILVAAQRAGAPLRHDCGGKALCGTCRVRVLHGAVSPKGERERIRLAAVGAATGERLACQTRPGSDISLEAVLPISTLAPFGEGKPDSP
jgi:adenylate cyclase